MNKDQKQMEQLQKEYEDNVYYLSIKIILLLIETNIFLDFSFVETIK